MESPQFENKDNIIESSNLLHYSDSSIKTPTTTASPYTLGKIPTCEDIKKAGLPNAELLFEVQEKARKAYSKSLEYQKGNLWFLNGYSLKPDVLEKGFEIYKDLILKEGDGRNPYLYGELKPKLKKNLADIIGSNRPKDIALGINATSFITQILSCYWGQPVRILTSNEEFYGTTRLLNRLKEFEHNVVTEISTEPFEDFGKRLYEEACNNKYDIVIISHVHFKSANVLDDLDELIMKLKPKVDKIVIDGSCAFGNLPIDKALGHVMDEIYWIGGVYKFIGAGEGFSFMSLPKDCKDRPVMTGWLFGNIQNESQYHSNPLLYADGGDRYTNSTLECSIWVRTNEILESYKRDNFSVDMKNQYTIALQDYMMQKIEEANISFLSKKNCASIFGKWRPLQTVFNMSRQTISAQELVERLEKDKIFPDWRGDRVRFCVAIYQNIFEIDYLIEKLKEIDNSLEQASAGF